MSSLPCAWEMLSILNRLSCESRRIKLIYLNKDDEIIIKPCPFAHTTMLNFLKDIQLTHAIRALDSHKIITFSILYEAHSPPRSLFQHLYTTKGLYLELNFNTAYLTPTLNLEECIIRAMKEQLKLLYFKCIIKFCIVSGEKVI